MSKLIAGEAEDDQTLVFVLLIICTAYLLDEHNLISSFDMPVARRHWLEE